MTAAGSWSKGFDPGADYYTRRVPTETRARAISQLESLGYRVTLAPLADTHSQPRWSRSTRRSPCGSPPPVLTRGGHLNSRKSELRQTSDANYRSLRSPRLVAIF